MASVPACSTSAPTPTPGAAHIRRCSHGHGGLSTSAHTATGTATLTTLISTTSRHQEPLSLMPLNLEWRTGVTRRPGSEDLAVITERPVRTPEPRPTAPHPAPPVVPGTALGPRDAQGCSRSGQAGACVCVCQERSLWRGSPSPTHQGRKVLSPTRGHEVRGGPARPDEA